MIVFATIICDTEGAEIEEYFSKSIRANNMNLIILLKGIKLQINLFQELARLLQTVTTVSRKC